MCGRTACTLAPDELCKACTSKTFHVEWRDHPGPDATYFTSYNVAPTSYTPVIFNGDHIRRLYDEEPESEYVMQPMMWNLIPHFYKGDTPKNCGYKTNNCRVEGIDSKQMFAQPLKKGQRCVVLCDGFYEWQSKDCKKTPHFIHAPQPEHVKIWNKSSWEEKNIDSKNWQGPVPLKMAGIFNRWKSSEGTETYSYSVLTTEAGKGFNWLHHRVPIILEREEDVKNWLDADIPHESVLKCTSTSPGIKTYVVSSVVNNSRNNTVDCLKPAEIKSTKPSGSSMFMASWLNKGKSNKRKSDDANENTNKATKKSKSE